MPKPLFSPTLLEEFPWVIYNESSGTLGCSLCSKHAIRRTTFALGMFSVTGSEAGRSFRRSDLSPHEKSAVHIRAAQLESGQGDAEMLPEDGDADVPIVIQARRTTSGGRGGSKDRPLTGTADASPTEDVEYSPGSPLQTTVSSSHLVIAHALPPHWKSLVASWLEEDAPGFDIGGYIVGETKQKAILYGKAPVNLLHQSARQKLIFIAGRSRRSSVLQPRF